MANSQGVCVICGGSPTVKAHLFPRALMLDLKAGEKALVEGSRHRDGVRFSQNGVWDDGYVCKRHEDECGAGDDYAVRFCRRLQATPVAREMGAARLHRNQSPELLVHFAYSILWRQVVSAEGRSLGLSLGPYLSVIEKALFEGGPHILPVLIGRSNLVIKDGAPARISIAPYRQKLGDWRVWHFVIGPLDIYIKTDKRPFPEGWIPYLANGNDPIYLPSIQPLDIGSVPMLKSTFDRMRRKRN